MTYHGLHQGHVSLLIDMLETGPENYMLFPKTGSADTLKDLVRLGLCVRAHNGLTGEMRCRLTEAGHQLAKKVAGRRRKAKAADKARRAAKERALHNIGHAIQFLTELDTPSDRMIDQTIGRLVNALDELQKVRKPEED